MNLKDQSFYLETPGVHSFWARMRFTAFVRNNDPGAWVLYRGQIHSIVNPTRVFDVPPALGPQRWAEKNLEFRATGDDGTIWVVGPHHVPTEEPYEPADHPYKGPRSHGEVIRQMRITRGQGVVETAVRSRFASFVRGLLRAGRRD